MSKPLYPQVREVVQKMGRNAAVDQIVSQIRAQGIKFNELASLKQYIYNARSELGYTRPPTPSELKSELKMVGTPTPKPAPPVAVEDHPAKPTSNPITVEDLIAAKQVATDLDLDYAAMRQTLTKIIAFGDAKKLDKCYESLENLIS